MGVVESWDELSREINHYYGKILRKRIIISFCYNVLLCEMKVFLIEQDKCSIPFYRAPLLNTYNDLDIYYKKSEIISDLVEKINGILNPKAKIEEVVNPDAKPQFCPCCGAPRKRNSMKCEYCEIEFF